MHPFETTGAGAIPIVLGLLLVFVGRKLFWVFVGSVGFFAGVHFAPELVLPQPAWMVVTIGIALGIVGALLAIVLQRVTVAVTGWFAGGLLASRLAVELGMTAPTAVAIAFVVGAILVAIVFAFLFDWALIVLTNILGVLMICDVLRLTPSREWAIAVGLVALGLLIQAQSLGNRAAPAPENTPPPGDPYVSARKH